jgi:hypothetical protein
LFTVIKPEALIWKVLPVLPETMAYTSDCPGSGSLAATCPTEVPSGLFSLTEKAWFSITGAVFVGVTEMVTAAVEESTGLPLSCTLTVRLKTGFIR